MGDEEAKQRLIEHPKQNEWLPTSLIWSLFVGHFLSRWTARMWEFSVALYMINIWPDSLLLTAMYGVVESASVALLGPIVGQWVNFLTYKKVLQIWTVTQNLSFIAAGGTVIALLTFSSLKSLLFASLVAVTFLSGAVAVLSTLAGTILIERECGSCICETTPDSYEFVISVVNHILRLMAYNYPKKYRVVLMTEDQPPGVLSKMNSVLRRIDLVCKLCAPVVSGFIVSFVSLKASALFFALWNILSVCLQYWLLSSVYNGVPALNVKDNQKREAVSSDVPETSTSPQKLVPAESGSIGCCSVFSCFGAWKVYLKQEVVLPGLALALLFLTVLSFGSLMTATLEWKGIPAYVISIGRGISATIGIAATFTYPILESRISPLRTGIWAIWSQWSLLVICVGSIYVKNGVASAYLLMAGVAASRLGLWMFDLAVIQQMQDQVPASDRCIVGGVQNSIQSTMDLLAYLMALSSLTLR
ncbi:hypothetical protein KSS87_023819 [Heliosperma pusillum]|nr:hypothetical protein KSS87_023819 [Heliosperma pusillum]